MESSTKNELKLIAVTLSVSENNKGFAIKTNGIVFNHNNGEGNKKLHKLSALIHEKINSLLSEPENKDLVTEAVEEVLS